MTERILYRNIFRVRPSDVKMYHMEEKTQEEFFYRVYLICQKPKEKQENIWQM